jgi:hypothetical protein
MIVEETQIVIVREKGKKEKRKLRKSWRRASEFGRSLKEIQ